MNIQVILSFLFLTFYVKSIDSQTLEDLIKKIETPLPPKGFDFAPIVGPKCLDSKIGIIGAGPSGVHMGYLLKQSGFTDVTIIEKTNRIGGKGEHFQYRGAKHPLSIVLWNEEYRQTLIPLLQKFGLLTNGEVSGYDRTGYWLTNDRSVPLLGAGQYSVAWVMQNLNISDSNLAQARIVQDMNRYTDIHRLLFGSYQFGIMRRPKNYVWKYLGGTAFEFLQRNNLLSLVPLFQVMFHTTGYSTIYQVPTLYGLIWLTPKLLIDTFTGVGLKNLKKGSMDEVFPLMVQDQNIPVIFNFDVKHVQKQQNYQLEVTSTKNAIMTFDFLIWSGLPSDFEKVASRNVLGYLDRKLFSTSYASHAASSMVDLKASNKGGISNVYVKNWDVFSFSDKVVIDTDMDALSQALNKNVYKNGTFTYADGEQPDKKWTFTAFQYGNQTYFPSLQTLRNELTQHYEGLGATNIEVLYTRTFDYFPRWNVQDAAQGYHWKMYDLQGKNNIWFIGGGLTFESVNNVMGYNQLLLSKMRPVLKTCRNYFNPYNPFYYGRK